MCRDEQKVENYWSIHFLVRFLGPPYPNSLKRSEPTASSSRIAVEHDCFKLFVYGGAGVACCACVYRRYQDDERNRRAVEANRLKRSVYGELPNCLPPTAWQNLTAHRLHFLAVLRTYHFVLKLQIAQLRQLEAVSVWRA